MSTLNKQHTEIEKIEDSNAITMLQRSHVAISEVLLWETINPDLISERGLRTVSSCWKNFTFQDSRVHHHTIQVTNAKADLMLASGTLWTWLDEIIVDQVQKIVTGRKCFLH